MKKKIIIGAVIGVILIAFVTASIIRSGSGASAFAAGPTFEVKVQRIERGNISSTISASGVVEEIERAEVFFDTPLKVKKILVEENERVAKGQKLVELDMDSLNSELEQLRLSRSIQVLAKVSASSQADVIRAQNAIVTAQRAYEDSLKNYKNSKSLFEANAISKNEMDMAEKAMKDAQTALENAEAGYESIATGRSTNLGTQDQNLKSLDLKISDLERKIAKINEAASSPLDGVVTKVNLTEGAFTSNMQAAFKVVNPDKLRVRADVKEFDIKDVKVGQKALIFGDAISKDEGVTGKVTSIASVAKKNQTTSGEETLVEVIVSIEKPSPILKPGLSVTSEITTNEKSGVLIASFMMLKEDKDNNKVVYVLEKKGNVTAMRERRVKLGVTSELNAEVLEGLNEGDMAVLDPMPNFKDNSRVKVIQDEKK